MIRIATWNLERPKLQGWKRNPSIIEKMREVNADLWILTETNAAISPGDDYFSATTLPVPNYHSLGESSTAIWTRWRMIRHIRTFDPECAICVEVESPIGLMMVYGTIITYANDRGPGGKSKRWVEHRKSIRKHSDDWQRIRCDFPHHHFVVGGDFNQSRDGSGWYEDKESLDLLTEGVLQSSLVCVTGDKMPELTTRSSIDHICISEGLSGKASAWEGVEDGNRMSDHNGVVVEIQPV